MTHDNEAIVRHAYHAAEGDVLDVAGFVDGFTDDGVFNNIVAGETYRGEHLGDLVIGMATILPDVHRELHRVTVLGDVVAVELSIQGTFLGPLETPAGVVEPTGAKIDVPTADFCTCATAGPRRSTATWGSASCSPRWASCPTSHRRSLRSRRPKPRVLPLRG